MDTPPGSSSEVCKDKKGEIAEGSKSNVDDINILLLEDSTLDKIPKHVEKILSHLSPTHSSDADIFMALVYCVALETGFVSISCVEPGAKYPFYWGYSFHSKTVVSLAKLPEKYRDSNNNNLYVLHLILINFPNTKSRLFAIKTGDYICITLTPDNEAGKSACLSMPRYVLSMRSKKLSTRLRNLKELSHTLKDKIFVPVSNLFMSKMDILFPGLNGLPFELFRIIARKLDDIDNLSKTCCKLQYQCRKIVLPLVINYVVNRPRYTIVN